MEDLYPAIEPYATGMLDVGDGHSIYWETSGNPAGKPAVVVHGGPGDRSAPMSRRHFNPEVYRIVLFDQRGCGRSTPTVPGHGDALSANTTWHLVSDMEMLREHLDIDRWQLLGGSWGATLALAYAQTHPARVSEIVLRGVFTARQSELDWTYNGGAAHLFPVEWARYLEPIADRDRDNPLAAYARLVNDPDPTVAERAALAWSAWEGAIVALRPSRAFHEHYARPEVAVPFARLALHYFAHGAWLEDGQLIRDATLLSGIPGTIVQGRYDLVCPPRTAYQLHKAWTGSTLLIAHRAGHAADEPGILRTLKAATDEFAQRTSVTE